jgi:uncharacterized protein
MKLIVVAAALALLVWLLLGRSNRRGSTPPKAARRQDAAPAAPEPMVSCAHCGVHLPRSEAALDGEVMYCTPAHRLAGPRSSGHP